MRSGQAIQNQHRNLHGAWQSLKQRMDQFGHHLHAVTPEEAAAHTTPGEAAAHDRVALAEDVRTLMGNLRAHFSEEEQSELYNGFSEEFPRYAETLDRLQKEHDEVMGELEAVLGQLKGNSVEARAISERFAKTIAALENHEAKENEILQQAYNEDLGGPD